MNFLPYERFTFQTRLTPDQVRQKLSTQMEDAHALLSWIPVTTNLAGSSTAEGYKFWTSPRGYIRRHRSTINGKVSYEMGITKIEVTFLPATYVLFFTILTFGFFGFIWFMLLREWIASIDTPYIFFPKHVLGIGSAILFGYAIFVIAVKLEAMVIKDMLESLFNITEK